jgi:hypothetical protein
MHFQGVHHYPVLIFALTVTGHLLQCIEWHQQAMQELVVPK